jgi:uncharacterized protein involved in exopolysaccharide biosynthesis
MKQLENSSTDTIQFQEILTIIRRNFSSSAFIIFLTTLFTIAIAFIVPKKFISHAVLNIQASYFQVPLVGDLVSNSNDTSEYKAQRESILRYSLSNDFLDQLGSKFDLFAYEPDDRRHVLERENLLSRIEYVGIGSDNYQISVRAQSADMAYQLTEAVLNQMVSTLMTQRMDKLTRTRSAIQANLESLKVDMASGGGSGHVSKSRDSLAEAEATLHDLEQRFTPSHPMVIEQRDKVEHLRSLEQEQPAEKESSHRSGGLSGPKRTLQDLYDDLLRKFNYLNIVIDMEKTTTNYPYLSVIERPEIPSTALFPKKPLFAVGGLILGLIFALLRVVFMEMRRGTFVNPATASQILEAPFLGSLPPWRVLDRQGIALPPPRTNPLRPK